MKAPQAIRDKCLLVLARQLAEELRYINYPKEWAADPLHGLFAPLGDVLNAHPAHLGDIIIDAFAKTTPKPQSGNISQLAGAIPDIFGKTKQYYLDIYEVERYLTSVKVTGLNLSSESFVAICQNDTERRNAANLALSIIRTFKHLRPSQENQHRTLERISFAMTPVCYAYDLANIGFDTAEYADQWRNLTVGERIELFDDIEERWHGHRSNN